MTVDYVKVDYYFNIPNGLPEFVLDLHGFSKVDIKLFIISLVSGPAFSIYSMKTLSFLLVDVISSSTEFFTLYF